jgi:hypothetical protein
MILLRKALRDIRAMGARALLLVLVIRAGVGMAAGIGLALGDVRAPGTPSTVTRRWPTWTSGCSGRSRQASWLRGPGTRGPGTRGRRWPRRGWSWTAPRHACTAP